MRVILKDCLKDMSDKRFKYTKRHSSCTCGSGAHPRRCKRHPCAWNIHVASMNLEDLLQDIEPEERYKEVMGKYDLVRKLRIEQLQRMLELIKKAYDNGYNDALNQKQSRADLNQDYLSHEDIEPFEDIT